MTNLQTTKVTMIPRSSSDRAADSVTAYLSDDHDRLDALLDEAVALVERADLDAAATTVVRFRAGLERHIRLEDQVLFPLFERLTGHRGPIEVMHREHRLIERALAAMASALDARDAAAFREHRDELLAVLEPHNEKEEAVIYPMVDDRLGEPERSRMAAELRRFGDLR